MELNSPSLHYSPFTTTLPSNEDSTPLNKNNSETPPQLPSALGHAAKRESSRRKATLFNVQQLAHTFQEEHPTPSSPASLQHEFQYSIVVQHPPQPQPQTLTPPPRDSQQLGEGDGEGEGEGEGERLVLPSTPTTIPIPTPTPATTAPPLSLPLPSPLSLRQQQEGGRKEGEKEEEEEETFSFPTPPTNKPIVPSLPPLPTNQAPTTTTTLQQQQQQQQQQPMTPWTTPAPPSSPRQFQQPQLSPRTLSPRSLTQQQQPSPPPQQLQQPFPRHQPSPSLPNVFSQQQQQQQQQQTSSKQPSLPNVFNQQQQQQQQVLPPRAQTQAQGQQQPVQGRQGTGTNKGTPLARLEGYLYKWTNLVKGWKRRYFVLASGVLMYFLDHQLKNCRGSVNLVNARLFEDKREDCTFIVTTPDQKSLWLRAESLNEKERWIAALGGTHSTLVDLAQQEQTPPHSSSSSLSHASHSRSHSNPNSTSVSPRGGGGGGEKQHNKKTTTDPIAELQDIVNTATLERSELDNTLQSLKALISNNRKLGVTEANEFVRRGDILIGTVQSVVSSVEPILEFVAAIQQKNLLLEEERATLVHQLETTTTASQNGVPSSAPPPLFSLPSPSNQQTAAVVTATTIALPGLSSNEAERTKNLLRSLSSSMRGVVLEDSDDEDEDILSDDEDYEFFDASDYPQLPEARETPGDSQQLPQPQFLPHHSSQPQFLPQLPTQTQQQAPRQIFSMPQTLPPFPVPPQALPPTPTLTATTTTTTLSSSVSVAQKEAAGVMERVPDHLEIAMKKSLLQGSGRKRTRLPANKSNEKVSIWGLVKESIGKDITKITLPVILCEPLSFLQRCAEDFEYSELLDIASNQPDSLSRLLYVAAFAISGYSSTERTGKPFNPLLGETFELVSVQKSFRLLTEQVCHHPPISAVHCESNNYSYWTDVEVKNKFWGKSLEVFPTGKLNLRLPKTDDYYTWNKLTTCVHNIMLGTLWVDNYGTMEIVDHKNRNVCKIEFLKRGWFASDSDACKVEAKVLDDQGVVRYILTGKWNESLFATDVGRNSRKGERFEIWRRATLPPSYKEQYEMTQFAIELNDWDTSVATYLPSTDSRFRPDKRYLEQGDMELSGKEKTRLEEKQRATRKERELRNEEWRPRWFTRSPDGSWVYSRNYWAMKANQAFPSLNPPLPDLY